MFIGAQITMVKTWKQSNCSSVDEWIKIGVHTHTHTHTHTLEYYLAIKKNESFSICNNMDGTRGYYL